MPRRPAPPAVKCCRALLSKEAFAAAEGQASQIFTFNSSQFTFNSSQHVDGGYGGKGSGVACGAASGTLPYAVARGRHGGCALSRTC